MLRVFLLGVCLCIPAVALAESKSGPAKFTGGNEINVSVGNKLKLDATFKVINIGPLTAVSVGGKMRNTSKSKLNYAYHVAFLDKDKNLVAAYNHTLFIDAGKEGPVGTFINLPPDQIARIAYYSVAFYESEKQIGSK